MIVLGIDPGLAMPGWGVVYKGQTDKLTCLAYGCMKTYPKDSLADRLKFIFTETQKIVDTYNRSSKGGINIRRGNKRTSFVRI